jgi:hypothetical protein
MEREVGRGSSCCDPSSGASGKRKPSPQPENDAAAEAELIAKLDAETQAEEED